LATSTNGAAVSPRGADGSARRSTSARTCGGAPIPGLLPFLHLDHIYYEGEVDIAGVEIPRTRRSLMASDHLPFLAELKVGFETATKLETTN
jgi:endonuclease/exonuclease/phosphatase family metal-dependent hydrolase